MAASLVFVVTRSDGDYLIRTHGVLPEQIKVVPNPINTHRFRLLPEMKRARARHLRRTAVGRKECGSL